ncbi:hypothetical protein PYCCODRAFT_1469189 [Trametes coccinea BRFM310]|uniref:C2H2-type domain-containing protein n=1 Tax=Trametes coccinea (strain BRFM310) TaxID=1353009 RepID=A0A1Y2IHV5_TRAC3|nr:hypothetical protein PYCCODRAFT_1469189 [Trametes coccinea BRFM310]
MAPVETLSGPGHSCEKCNKDFPSQLARTQHFVQSPLHAYCQRCSLEFPSFDILIGHLRSAHHCCDFCSSGTPILDIGALGRLPGVFDSEPGLHAHRRREHADLYCAPCKRMFNTPSNLDSHRRSALHAGRFVVCPANKCGKRFVSLAAILIHLESGACPSGVSLYDISNAAASTDVKHVITTNDASDNVYSKRKSAVQVIIRTPMLDEQVEIDNEPYKCAVCNKQFSTLQSLTAHRRSPAHAAKIYRCPLQHGGCGARFRTLSSLCQHVESEACGVQKCEVERAVRTVLKQLFE